jgi:hypothetical protein
MLMETLIVVCLRPGAKSFGEFIQRQGDTTVTTGTFARQTEQGTEAGEMEEMKRDPQLATNITP